MYTAGSGSRDIVVESKACGSVLRQQPVLAILETPDSLIRSMGFWAIRTHTYHGISYHNILYHIMSCHAMPCHVIAYHIIPYHIVSYHVYIYTDPEARLLKKVNRRIGFSAKSISYIDIAQESIIGLKSYQFCIENLTFNIMIYIFLSLLK